VVVFGGNVEMAEDSQINGLGDANAYLKWRAWGKGENIRPWRLSFCEISYGEREMGAGFGKSRYQAAPDYLFTMGMPLQFQ